VQWKWTSTKEYLDVLGTRLGINVAALVGHIAVRHYVMGEDAVEREATPEEITQMQRLVRQGMEAGAVGFSTNQNPRHMREDKKPVASRLASKEELASLLDVLGEMNAGVVQLSGGGADSRGRIGYAADLARRTGRPVLWQSISHSWSRPNFWQEMLVNTERVFKEVGLPIYAMTQAKPFQNRYTLLDAQCFDEFATWKAAMFNTVEARKKMFAILMCEKNCAQKRSRTDPRRFFQDGGMLFSSITSSSREISRLRESRWKRFPTHREKTVWIVSWIYRSKKISISPIFSSAGPAPS
jgi:N-acyl-D-aspartate/D-glutamate deacylase